MRKLLSTFAAVVLLALVAPIAAVWTLAVVVGHKLHDAAFNYMARTGLVMGSAQILPLQPFQNVVASGVALCDLASLFGYSVERVILQLGGGAFTKAMITALQLKANSKIIIDTTGSRLDSRNQYRGITANASFLTIDFLELRAKTKLGMIGGAIDTLGINGVGGVSSLRLEVTIAGATTPTLQGYAEVSVPQTAPEAQGIRPLIARVHNAAQTIGAAGTFALLVPHMDPNAGGSIFKRIALFSANCTGARIERNGVREWELNSTAANNFNQTEYGKAPQASLFMIDFVVDNLFEERVLDTRRSAGCTTAAAYGTFSGGETITVEAETLEPLSVY